MAGRGRGGLRQAQLRIAVGGRGGGSAGFPRGDAGLHSVVLGGGFIPAFHVKKGEVRVDQLFVGAKGAGFVALGDGGGVVAFSIESHAQGQSGLEMCGIFGQDLLELGDGPVVIPPAEVEGGLVVFFLVSGADRHQIPMAWLPKRRKGVSCN